MSINETAQYLRTIHQPGHKLTADEANNKVLKASGVFSDVCESWIFDSIVEACKDSIDEFSRQEHLSRVEGTLSQQSLSSDSSSGIGTDIESNTNSDRLSDSELSTAKDQSPESSLLTDDDVLVSTKEPLDIEPLLFDAMDQGFLNAAHLEAYAKPIPRSSKVLQNFGIFSLKENILPNVSAAVPSNISSNNTTFP